MEKKKTKEKEKEIRKKKIPMRLDICHVHRNCLVWSAIATLDGVPRLALVVSLGGAAGTKSSRIQLATVLGDGRGSRSSQGPWAA